MLILANPSKVKPDDSDAAFWEQYLKDEGENPNALDIGPILKYGTAESGHWGHSGGEGGSGNPGGSRASGEVGAVEDARDARHAERLGLVRAQRGKDGKWRTEDGKQLPKHIRERLTSPIPPAWRNVYINPSVKSCDEGRYAVRARDEKGETKGLYLKGVVGERQQAKHGRVNELDGKISRVIAENERNLKGPYKEEASVLKLIMSSAIRPGSDDDTKAAVKAYGAVTLLGKHVYKTRDGVELRFPAKKGTFQVAKIMDKDVAKDVLARAKAAGKKGDLFDTTYKSLWKYTKDLDGKGFLPKDFRTLAGTREAVKAMKQFKVPSNEKEYKKSVKEVAKIVASKLGNTPTVALQHYINPSVFGKWRGNW